MYLRPAFNETDLGRIAAMIEQNSFGTLVTHGPNGLLATHVPFLVKRAGEKLVLTAHLGAPNPQCALLDGGDAMAIFTGPHAYISPLWYRTQPAVPTWDYVAVHIHGKLEAVTEPDEISDILRALAVHDPEKFDLDTLPDKFRQHDRGHPCFPAARRAHRGAMENEPEPQPRRSRGGRRGAQGAGRSGGGGTDRGNAAAGVVSDGRELGGNAAALEAFPLEPLALHLAGPADRLGGLAGAAFGRLLVVPPQLHFSEDAFSLHFLLERFQRLVDVVIPYQNLHLAAFSCR